MYELIALAIAAIVTAVVTATESNKRAQNYVDQVKWENENRQLPAIFNFGEVNNQPQITLFIVVGVLSVVLFLIIKNARIQNG